MMRQRLLTLGRLFQTGELQILRRRSLLIVLVAILSGIGLHSARAQTAAPAISVHYDFEFIRQGQVGVIGVDGSDLAQGTATAFGHDYACYPTSAGLACPVAVPMEMAIKDHPISIAAITKDGKTLPWQSVIAVASGQFVAENFILPGNLNYLLREDIQLNEDDRLKTSYSLITPARYWEGVFTPPVNGGLISTFGAVRSYGNGIVRRHTGVDLRAGMGTPVLASASGRVVLSRPMDIHGNNVVIDHGWGIFTEYAHLSQRYVVPGQYVLQGDVIGLSGNTGRSTGPHVHWEVAVGGVWVSPLAFAQVKLPQ